LNLKNIKIKILGPVLKTMISGIWWFDFKDRN